jgi:hypothetical protein
MSNARRTSGARARATPKKPSGARTSFAAAVSEPSVNESMKVVCAEVEDDLPR